MGERISFSEAAVRSRGRRCLCRARASTAAWGSLIRCRTERAPARTADPARGRALAGAHRLPDPGLTQLVSLGFRDGRLIYVVY